MLLRKAYIWTTLEYAPNKIIAYSDENGNELHVIHDWKVVHTIMDLAPGNGSKDDFVPLPNFDLDKFPFLVTSGKESFGLINVKAFEIDDLVKGSA